ncbi:MAG: hypothetical protein KDA90_22990, partial [Planctomycetaceae bacterium]|nr:hypothetical protein [Planctomycetaceae bacterium]
MNGLALFSVLATSLVVATPDSATYGPVLKSQVVEGSSGCTAVEVAGDYLYAAGDGSLTVFEITSDPAHPK